MFFSSFASIRTIERIVIILIYGTVTELHKLFLFLKHSSERPCEQEFFYVKACISETYRYVLLALENSCREVEALRKEGKKRAGLKGKIDKHENPSKVLRFSDGVYR